MLRDNQTKKHNDQDWDYLIPYVMGSNDIKICLLVLTYSTSVIKFAVH